MGGTVTIIVPIVPQTHAYGYLNLCAPAQAPYETCGPGHQEPHLSWTRHALGSRGPPHRVGLGTWNDTRPSQIRTPAQSPSEIMACTDSRTSALRLITRRR